MGMGVGGWSRRVVVGGRMGRENTGGFVTCCNREVRWAGSRGEEGCRGGLNPPLPDSHILGVFKGEVWGFYVFIWKKDSRHSVPLREAGSLLLCKD